MSRPLYESGNDRLKERTVMELVGHAWGVEFLKLPMRYRFDFGVMRDGYLKGFAEVKCRNNRHDTYPTFFISSEKVKAATEWDMLGIKCVFILAFTDGIFMLDPRTPDHYAPGGRTDRNDPDDTEIMAHFKTSQLRRIKVDSGMTHGKISHSANPQIKAA